MTTFVSAMLLLCASGMLCQTAPAEVSSRPPNIILVLADDLGMSRVSCYGGAPFKTPCLDQLARAGLRFERAYSMPICGPSRAALLTGKYPFRTGAIDNGSSVIDPLKHATIPMLLKQAGYATCAVGKLGQSAPEDDVKAPGRLGFDESMLWMGRGTPDRYWSPVYQRNDQVVRGAPTDYGPDLTHEFLVDFMQRNRHRPFFAYYSAVLTHEPLTRTPDSKDNTRLLQDMVAYLDKQMEKLTKDLERLSLRDNTIIIFTSDNGPDNAPLGTVRGSTMIGRKGDVEEGGVAAPLIVNCPALVPGGRVCSDLTDFTDLLPTILELARVRPQDGLRLDGRSIAPQFLGKQGNPREWVYAQHRNRYFIADQRYKLYGDGRFVDISDSPASEAPIILPDSNALQARQRLATALTNLRSGFTEATSNSSRLQTFSAPGPDLTADIQFLRKRGLMNGTEDWVGAVKTGCPGKQMAGLLLEAANKFETATNTAQALDILRSEKVIQAVEYWKRHAVDGGKCSGENVGRFIVKLAQRLRAP
jgi:arylsulfatase A